MTCIVVEDEEVAIQYMGTLIDKVTYLELIQSFTDPTEALLFLSNNPVDLIFIDIEMPKVNGVEFIQLAGSEFKYIITSAYSKYAVKGFDLDTVDFLYKPFSFDRFLKAVQKVQQLIDKPTADKDLMYIKIDKRLQAIHFAEICWIESIRSSTEIHTETEAIKSWYKISDIEKELPSSLFTRVHKSYIVANSRIAIIDPDTVSIRCNNQLKVIPTGESYRKTLIQSIDAKIIKKPER